ncbi:MAG: glycosyltransferase, partial [Promethearchaeota archaeon]
MRFFKKLGIFSFEDFMYAGSTFVLAMYVICILVITLFQIAGQSVIFSSRFSLCSLDIQFPFFLIICIVLMYLSMFIWIFMGFASIFYRKKVDLEQEDDSTLISVLIPAHNEEDVIEGILGDLVAQEYKNLEIIVLAHNCTDSTISR